MNRLLLAACAASVATGCAARSASFGPSVVHNTGVEVPSAPNVSAAAALVLAQPDRAADDRALDGPKQAGEVLTYLDLRPGMNVAVLAPGTGYLMELVARSVGSTGRLFARNPPSLLAASGLADAWEERLERPAGAVVVRIDDELGKPLAVQWLDLVFLDYDYGALRTRATDPSALVTTAWSGLHHGGRFVVVAREPDAEKARGEIQRHGFRLSSEGRFLAQGADPCDWSDQPNRGKSVLLTFVKP